MSMTISAVPIAGSATRARKRAIRIRRMARGMILAYSVPMIRTAPL
jgi:hypothetical protein